MRRFIVMTVCGPFYFLTHSWMVSFVLCTLILLFTVLTQVGGMVLWLALPVLDKVKFKRAVSTFLTRASLFIGIYVIVVMLILPRIAPAFGRTALPWFSSDQIPLRPVNIAFCILARNYVKPELKITLEHAAKFVSDKHPGTILTYLDANFPLVDGFPLLPHLSHKDGKKVDLAFFYQNKQSGQPLEKAVSHIGYWAYEQPLPHEIQPCKNKKSFLRWNFDWLQSYFSHATLDEKRTKTLLTYLSKTPGIQKIFIEPHLKARLAINHSKVRFQGCSAARHDDHIHIQIR